MIADIHSRIDALSKSKKLPQYLDKAKLESAKSGLAEVSKAWIEATPDEIFIWRRGTGQKGKKYPPGIERVANA